MRQDAVTRDRRYGPLMAKRSEGRKVVECLVCVSDDGCYSDILSV